MSYMLTNLTMIIFPFYRAILSCLEAEKWCWIQFFNVNPQNLQAAQTAVAGNIIDIHMYRYIGRENEKVAPTYLQHLTLWHKLYRTININVYTDEVKRKLIWSNVIWQVAVSTQQAGKEKREGWVFRNPRLDLTMSCTIPCLDKM